MLIKEMAGQIENGRPIPWVGMPVYLENIGSWCFVSKCVNYCLMGRNKFGSPLIPLASYGRKDTSLILAGEPNGPKMSPMETQLADAEGPFCGMMICEENEWNVTPYFAGAYYYSKFLFIPERVGLIGLFDYDQSKLNSQKQLDLKTLNQDGRQTCASCGIPLKEPYPGIRYCPVCEG